MIKKLLKMFKHLFYDIIPKFYNVKWYKEDFKSKLDYYYWLPFRYLFFLILSLLDKEVVIYRISFIIGFLKGLRG